MGHIDLLLHLIDRPGGYEGRKEKKVNCEGRLYEDLRGDEWPCCDCSRIEREDMFEPIEEEEE